MSISLAGFCWAHSSRTDLEVLVCVIDVGVFLHGLSMTTQEVLGRQKSLDAHRASRMQPPGGNANLSAKAESEAVAEPSRRIHIDASTVDLPQELFSQSLVLCRMNA